jgi:hypothetical protein
LHARWLATVVQGDPALRNWLIAAARCVLVQSSDSLKAPWDVMMKLTGASLIVDTAFQTARSIAAALDGARAEFPVACTKIECYQLPKSDPRNRESSFFVEVVGLRGTVTDLHTLRPCQIHTVFSGT